MSDEVERRQHWLQLAREMGAEDDFRALLDDVRRENVDWREMFKRYAQVVEYHESYTYLTPDDWTAEEWPSIIAALDEAGLRPDAPIRPRS